MRIGELGIVVLPDLAVPNGCWNARAETVTVVEPGGERFETTAEFNLTDFNISDPSVSIDRRWRVVLALPGRTKGELPVGTKILVSQEVRNELLPEGSG